MHMFISTTCEGEGGEGRKEICTCLSITYEEGKEKERERETQAD